MTEQNSMGYFDAHCHLQDAQFDMDRAEMIAASRAAGVSHFIVPATDVGNFDATLTLAAADERIFCGLGIHPHSAKEWNSDVRERIREEAAKNKKIVMVGEIGLDYHYDFAPRDVQREAFSEQIELAIELKKPIAIHTRESEEDVFRIVEEHYASLPADVPRGQFHCFSASIDWMHRAIALGFYVSFTGNITFKKSPLDEVVREAPLERILLETDSPYLAPDPHRGKRNSPAMLPFTA
ncbi:MAG TPA: TatD family hydrolase, partial [Candidatus Kapabacteria bacterium]